MRGDDDGGFDTPGKPRTCLAHTPTPLLGTEGVTPELSALSTSNWATGTQHLQFTTNELQCLAGGRAS